MKIVEIIKMQTYVGHPESDIVRTLNAVKTFCTEQNVFIEDVEYEVIVTNGFRISDNYSGILLLVSLDLDVLRKLYKETQAIIDKHTDDDGECSLDWDAARKDLEELEEKYNEDSK